MSQSIAMTVKSVQEQNSAACSQETQKKPNRMMCWESRKGHSDIGADLLPSVEDSHYVRSSPSEMIATKAVILCCLALLSSVHLGLSAFLGQYRSRVESIRDLDDIPRDKMDWKLILKKLNRTEQVLDGYIQFKEEVGPLELTINLEKWADGGYKKFLTDGMTTDNVCIDKEYKVIMENYNGTLSPDCIFQPETRYLKPFNIDREMHKHVQRTIYGKFRITMRFHANGRDVMGFRVVVIYEKI